MAKKVVSIDAVGSPPPPPGTNKKVAPGKRPNHAKLRKRSADEIQWENNLDSEVLLIFNPVDSNPHDVREAFQTPPKLVTPIPPHTPSASFKVKRSAPKGFYKYKVYVVDDDNFAKAGSDAEFEVL